MKQLFFVLIFVLSACQVPETFEADLTDTGDNVQEVFYDAFHSPECSNPCWLDIEVGKTDRKTVISTLEENKIDYDAPGVIHLYSLPSGTVPGAQAQEITPSEQSPEVFGDINVGQQSNDVVQSLDFWIDLCVSTVIEVYGVPSVWSTQGEVPTLLVYPDYQLFFAVDRETSRTNWVSMHMEEGIPPPNELENWSQYASLFSSECVDEFVEEGDL